MRNLLKSKPETLEAYVVKQISINSEDLLDMPSEQSHRDTVIRNMAIKFFRENQSLDQKAILTDKQKDIISGAVCDFISDIFEERMDNFIKADRGDQVTEISRIERASPNYPEATPLSRIIKGRNIGG